MTLTVNVNIPEIKVDVPDHGHRRMIAFAVYETDAYPNAVLAWFTTREKAEAWMAAYPFVRVVRGISGPPLGPIPLDIAEIGMPLDPEGYDIEAVTFGGMYEGPRQFASGDLAVVPE